MSKPADSPEMEALAGLEAAVAKAVDRIRELEAQLEKSEAQNAESDEMLRHFSKDADAPRRVMGQLSTLEAENRDMRERLEKGREAVERLLARIRFLEDQR